MTRANDLDTVREVLSRNKDKIMTKYDAAGLGIGRADPASAAYVIVVYLKTRDRQPAEKVDVEGIPLKFEVTGPFKVLRRNKP